MRLADGRIAGTVAVELPDVDWLQHVCGLQAGDDEEIFELATWYAELEIWPRYEVPVDYEDDLLHTLLAVEAKPTGALAVLAAPAADLAPAEPSEGVTVRPVEAGSTDVGTFAATILAGHGVPEDTTPDHLAAVAAFVDEDGWHAYLAELNGVPVGAGVVVIADGLGYLANAATVPTARARGVQSALIAARLDACRAASCDLVCSLAEADSPSARNLVRAGLAVAGARTYWTSSP